MAGLLIEGRLFPGRWTTGHKPAGRPVSARRDGQALTDPILDALSPHLIGDECGRIRTTSHAARSDRSPR
jgi:hypothetical protein